MTPEFFISIVNDQYFAGWSGKIASFKTGKEFTVAFKIDAAADTILKPKKEEEKPIDIKIDPIKEFQRHQSQYQLKNQQKL